MRCYFTLIFLTLSSASAEPWLSDEGKTMLAAHEFLLGEFSGRHTPEFDESGRLRRIALKNSSYTVDGETELELPAGTERVAQFMRYFEIHGTGLDSLGGIRLLPVAPESSRGLDTPIRGAINGHPFEHDTAWGRGVKNFFEQAIIPIPAEHLKTENTITLDHLEDDTTVSEVHLRVDGLEG